MKISELEQVLNVEKDDDKETHLVDPKTGTKTIIDKTKNPTAIAPDETGKLKMSKSAPQGTQQGGQKPNLQGKQVTVTDDLARIRELAGTPTKAPPMPDITGLQPGTPKDLDNGERVTVNKDGTVAYSGGWGEYVYDKMGKFIKHVSPRLAGYGQETDAQGTVTKQTYSAGGMDIEKGPEGTKANYDLGIAKMSTTADKAGAVKNASFSLK